ncbi:hypothetical protein EON64_19895 [archaeon]|nr:MAG: hypothetical protein EON64_19895 [archaeon]
MSTRSSVPPPSQLPSTASGLRSSSSSYVSRPPSSLLSGGILKPALPLPTFGKFINNLFPHSYESKLIHKHISISSYTVIINAHTPFIHHPCYHSPPSHPPHPFSLPSYPPPATDFTLPPDYKQPGYIGIYAPAQRKERIDRFLEKRGRRVWTKKVKYDVRKNFADSRMRVKGRFVKKEDEDVMRDLYTN